MNSNNVCRIPKSTVTEDAAFWQQHLTAQAASELSKSAYCHLHRVDYARFIYWARKAAKASGDLAHPALVQIKLAADAPVSAGLLCTLQFKRGSCLQIHEASVLNFIFDKLT